MRFALIGAAGYIAPRHMAAIKSAGGELVCAYDPHDSVGALERQHPDCEFFSEFERFDRFVDKQRRYGRPIEYVTVCSPNYLHDAHARWGMRSGADVICEKPLVIKPHNLDGLSLMEKETGRRVWCIQQLRLHPELVYAKSRIADRKDSEASVSYITPRGKWYASSWKGDHAKSGGVLMNIGIHLFDAMIYLFGSPSRYEVFKRSERAVQGTVEFERGKMDFNLSTDERDVPEGRTKPVRSIDVNGERLSFSEGFEELHCFSYMEIMNGRGFGIEDCRPAIELVNALSNYKRIGTDETRRELHDLAPGEKRAA